ncbi:trypsin-like peptidase domain-containing protein [Comamonas testosteroni]|uniref:trypsin-like peptidase domain-containing protein n=1 Tax=Comamonas testosteroni TaxID=285 RepID=UPI00265DF4B3|nr:trypsin-like peptidase domain-containing protein [Comamonas testosteroni]WKL15916.1 trypsin-like peptidase domain-containing protein [Comamonas testosteroni]
MRVETFAEQLFFTTVQIRTFSANGDQGSGTGFFYASKFDKGEALFIVTNKHVYAGTAHGEITFHLAKNGKPDIGNTYTVQLNAGEWAMMWHGHPNPDVDIAVAPLAPILEFVRNQHQLELFFRSIPESLSPNEEEMHLFDAIEPVTFIGYPNGIWDSKNFLPVARRGTTATPLEVDFENTPRFVVDASVFGGSSGSPVFVIHEGARATRNGSIVANGGQIYFVGVIAAVFHRVQTNMVKAIPIPTGMTPVVSSHEMLDLGIVFKARTVAEAAESCLRSYGF